MWLMYAIKLIDEPFGSLNLDLKPQNFLNQVDA